MNLEGERLIPASPAKTWAALNDADTLKACIAGCESLERVGDDEYHATLAMRIGPVSARFKGRLRLEDIVPISSYTIAFDGQGGVAGFGKGSAGVQLTPESTGTRLRYSAKAQVGGKVAQVGSRLIEGAAAKIADNFFTAFEARVAAAESSKPGEEEQAVLPSATPLPTPASPRRSWLVWAVVAATLAILVLLAYRMA